MERREGRDEEGRVKHTQSRSYSMPSRNLSVVPPILTSLPPDLELDTRYKDAINFWSARFRSVGCKCRLKNISKVDEKMVSGERRGEVGTYID